MTVIVACKGQRSGDGLTEVVNGPQRPLASLLRETDCASLTSQYLIWPSNVNGTRPETYDRVDFSTSLQYCPATVTRWHHILAHTICSTVFNIKSSCSLRNRSNPSYNAEKSDSHEWYNASTDSPRLRIKELIAVWNSSYALIQTRSAGSLVWSGRIPPWWWICQHEEYRRLYQ